MKIDGIAKKILGHLLDVLIFLTSCAIAGAITWFLCTKFHLPDGFLRGITFFILMCTAWVVTWVVIVRLMPQSAAPRPAAKSEEEQIEDLEKAGRLHREHFRAVRAFEVEESEDEGSQYFIELEDKRVLFLAGQYIYDYEPREEDPPEPPNPRTFPCTEFEVLRYVRDCGTKDGWGINCIGTVIEPECTTPPFTDYAQIPEDGTIISDRSYDEIKMERGVKVSGSKS